MTKAADLADIARGLAPFSGAIHERSGDVFCYFAGFNLSEFARRVTAQADAPAILPQRMSETTDNAIKALTGLFSILRGKSFAKDHYQLEISHGLYNELRDVRDRLVAERTAALTRPKCGGSDV